jgi:hypothetical protein
MALSRQDVLDRLRHVRNGDLQSTEQILRAFADGDTRAEMELIGLRARSTYYEDFLAAGVDTVRLSTTAGSGTGNAALTTVAGAMNGEATLKSASDSGTNAANGSTLTMKQLNWKASNGGLVNECKVKIDNVTQSYMFIGFTDTISTTVECPCTLSTINTAGSDATDAAGVLFDCGLTTPKLAVVGVSNDTDATAVISTRGLTASTYVTVRVEIDATGEVRGYVDGSLIGRISAALRTTIGLTPCWYVSNRAAAQITMTLDYVAVQQNR